MAGMCRLRSAVIGRFATPLPRFFRSSPPRFYGAAAAQPLIDDDYYFWPESDAQSRSDQVGSAVSMIDSEGSVPTRGVQWVFLGTPITKKHVYARKLSKLLQVPYISIASLVGQELSPRSSLYNQIANAVNQGKLVPDDTIFRLLSNRLEDGYYRGESGFILDGIPRTMVEAEILDQLADVELAVNFKCSEDFLIKNHGSNMISHCYDSHGMRNIDSTSFEVPSQRMHSNCSLGNTETSFNEKLQAYAKRIKPLEDYYRKQKKLLDFRVDGAPADIWRGLLAALQLQHINAIHSSQTLTSGSRWL